MPQKREQLIVAIERMQLGHKDRTSGQYTPGLKDIEAEIEKAEKALFDLRLEQENATAQAFKDGKNADKVIKDYRAKIDSEKTRLETLRIKQKGLAEAIKVKQKEFAQWELKKLKEQQETLAPRFLVAIKDRDAKEKEFETAQKEVQNVQFLKLDTRRKIDRLQKELAETVPQLTAEEKEEQRQRSDFERRCEHVFKQIDDEILTLLLYETEHGRRLEKLRTLRVGQAGMINKIVFPWKLKRPPNRPNPFEGFNDSEIVGVSYKDAVTLRHGAPQEKGTIRKKYLGKGKVESDPESWKTTPAPPTG